MNAASWWNSNGRKWTRRLAAPFLALALVGSVVTYECVKPNAASAAAVAPAPAGPLDASSVSALTALDKAMETLAARVTPPVVKAPFGSKRKPEIVATQLQEDMQQFFGHNCPFGQSFGPHI